MQSAAGAALPPPISARFWSARGDSHRFSAWGRVFRPLSLEKSGSYCYAHLQNLEALLRVLLQLPHFTTLLAFARLGLGLAAPGGSLSAETGSGSLPVGSISGSVEGTGVGIAGTFSATGVETSNLDSTAGCTCSTTHCTCPGARAGCRAARTRFITTFPLADATRTAFATINTAGPTESDTRRVHFSLSGFLSRNIPSGGLSGPIAESFIRKSPGMSSSVAPLVRCPW